MKKSYIIPLIALLLLVTSAFFYKSRMLQRDADNALVSENNQLTCSGAQFNEYMKIMLEAGKMTLSQPPVSGTRAQQQKMIDALAALDLPRNQTVIAVGHFRSGKVYTQICKDEKCSMEDMAQPEHVCLTENWDECVYLAMQFREKQYCFLTPAKE